MSWREREFHLLPSSPFSPLEKKKRKESSQLSFLPLFFFMPLTSSLVNNKKEKKKKRRNAPKDFSPVFFLMQFKIRLERRWQEKRGEDEQPPLPEGGMMLFFLRRERLQMCCGAPPYILPIPPSIPCLSTAHVTSLVAMATAPHVADRRRKRRGRGVEDKRVKREWKEKGGKRREDWKKNPEQDRKDEGRRQRKGTRL